MSGELSYALGHLIRRDSASIMEEMNDLIVNYTEKDRQEAVLEKDNNGWLPIHWACTIYRPPLEVIQMLLGSDTHKKSILVKDKDGRLPIHFACMYNAPIEVIQFFLDSDADKKTILEKDNNGQLPIHRSCRGGATAEVIQLLLESDVENKSIFEKDNDGKLPIHRACEDGGQLEVVQLLLQLSIWERIEQLGLAQWRIGVEELMNAMTEEDSKTKKVRQIYSRLSRYEEMERTISLLALAVWRTSCLKWGDIQFKSMQEMEDLRATDEAFDAAEYKRECRIKSGVDIIIRGVLPFLPVEDDDSDSESSSSDAGADLF